MPLPTISTLPTPPSRSASPATFSNDADTFFNAFPALVSQINDWSSQLPANVNGIDYNGTSTTSVAIGTGAKVFTTQTGKNFQIGQFVIVANTATPANFMSGQITAYNSGTGSLTVNVTTIGGTGTFAAWTISLSASSTAYLPLSGGTLTGSTFLSSGSLGVGTVTPSQRLDVTSATDADGIIINNSSASGGRLRLNSTGTGGRNYSISSTANTSGFGGGRFVISDLTASDAVRFAIDLSGNVGVGTASPTNPFEVRRDQAATTNVAIRNANTGVSVAAAITLVTGTANSLVAISVVDGTSRAISNGSAITSAFDDSDSHTFRTNAGVTKLSLDVNGSVNSTNRADAVGYKGLPQNTQSAAYTFAMADQGKHVLATGASVTLTIPGNSTTAFPIGTAITIICEDATKTVAPAAGVTLVQAGSGTTGSRTLAIGALATIIKVGTDKWYISGAGVS